MAISVKINDSTLSCCNLPHYGLGFGNTEKSTTVIVFAVIETERLLIKIAEQVKRSELRLCVKHVTLFGSGSSGLG